MWATGWLLTFLGGRWAHWGCACQESYTDTYKNGFSPSNTAAQFSTLCCAERCQSKFRCVAFLAPRVVRMGAHGSFAGGLLTVGEAVWRGGGGFLARAKQLEGVGAGQKRLARLTVVPNTQASPPPPPIASPGLARSWTLLSGGGGGVPAAQRRWWCKKGGGGGQRHPHAPEGRRPQHRMLPLVLHTNEAGLCRAALSPPRKPVLLRVRTRGDQHKAQEESGSSVA